MKSSAQKGFTLIELLVVIGILAILFSIVLIAINPARQFGQANDTKMRSDTLQILNSIHQYVAENSGGLPTELTAPLVKTAFNSASALNTLCDKLMPKYISAIPVAPSINNGSGAGVGQTTCATTPVWNTGYSITVDATGRVTVSADKADVNSNVIQITR